MITYCIPGSPIALARPRVSFRQHIVFDSQKLEKLAAGLALRNQHEGQPVLKGTPLHMDIVFYMKMPKSSEKNKNKLRGKPHIFKPDVDNLIKMLLDECMSVIFVDDCCVYSVTARKVYDDNPRTEFTIQEMEK